MQWRQISLHKLSFPLRISSVNVIISAGSCRLGQIYWRNPKTSLFSNGKILCLCLGQKEKNTIASGNANDEKKFNPGGLTFFTNLIEVLKKKFALKQLLKKRFSLLKNKESYLLLSKEKKTYINSSG